VRTQRPSLRTVVFLVALATATSAHAACPDRRASCVLHEEGVALFLEGKHELAAAKFAAAISAEPTARSYLGYAQAVEALGQIALSYDSMVAAQRLSQSELQGAAGKDVDITARAERIKYKLGELRAKIGFAWLRVPEGVPAKRVVSVQRQGEGDLKQPLTQWTAVSPGRQVLVAALDDGTRLEVVAEIAAGSQGVVVIPIAVTAPVRPVVPGGPPPGGAQPGGPMGIMVPLQPPDPPITTYIAFGGSLLAPGPENDGGGFDSPQPSSGNGFTALYERRFVPSLGLAVRADYLFHGESENFNVNGSSSVKGSEFLLMAGGRTWGSRTLHGRATAGFSIYSQEVSDATGRTLSEITRLFPTLELGGGVHLGRLRIQMGILFAAGGNDEVSLGTRFFGTLAIDLFRK
jgi:hypothetical protein